MQKKYINVGMFMLSLLQIECGHSLFTLWLAGLKSFIMSLPSNPYMDECGAWQSDENDDCVGHLSVWCFSHLVHCKYSVSIPFTYISPPSHFGGGVSQCVRKSWYAKFRVLVLHVFCAFSCFLFQHAFIPCKSSLIAIPGM